MSTIERAFALARTGKYATLAQLQRKLTEEGCRAVKPLLAPRSISSYLEAICAASSNAAPKRAEENAPANQGEPKQHAMADAAPPSKAES